MSMYNPNDFRQYATATVVGPDAHLDVPLGNVAISAFMDGTSELIGSQLYPTVPVGKQSDKYYIIDKGAFLRRPGANDGRGAQRAPRTRANRVEFQVSSDRYFAENYALATDIAAEDLANADRALMLRENSTRLVTGNLLREQEIRIANQVTSLTNLGSGTTLAGANKWSDYVNSDPIGDVNSGHAFIERQTGGLIANTAIMDIDTWRIVRRHPDLLDMYKYTSGGQLNMQQIADVFEVDRILIGRAKKENALEGGTSSITNIWGNQFTLAHLEQSVGLQTQTFGLRFQWTAPGLPAPMAVMRDMENKAGSRHVEVVEVMHFQDEKIVAADLAYGIAGTI